MIDSQMPKKCLRREIGLKLMSVIRDWNGRGAWRVRRFISDVLMRPPIGEIQCSTVYGFNIIVNPSIDNGVEKAIYYTGSYEAGTLAAFCNLLSEGDVLLDVGANIGLMSILGATLVGKTGSVYSFEPVPELNKILQRNVLLNNLGNIHVQDVALGSSFGTSMIFSHPEINRGSSSMVRDGSETVGSQVQVKTLDQFIGESLNTQRIRLIKIDVEGWELEVLKGGMSTFTHEDPPIVCIEYSNLHPIEGGNLIDIYYFFHKLQYLCFKLEKGKSTPSKFVLVRNEEDLPDHDNLFFFAEKTISTVDPLLF